MEEAEAQDSYLTVKDLGTQIRLQDFRDSDINFILKNFKTFLLLRNREDVEKSVMQLYGRNEADALDWRSIPELMSIFGPKVITVEDNILCNTHDTLREMWGAEEAGEGPIYLPGLTLTEKRRAGFDLDVLAGTPGCYDRALDTVTFVPEE